MWRRPPLSKSDLPPEEVVISKKNTFPEKQPTQLENTRPKQFLEEEEKRALAEIPSLQLLRLFHQEQQEALQTEKEQSLRNIRALHLIQTMRQMGKTTPPQEKSEFQELWTQPIEKLQDKIKYGQKQTEILQQIQEHFQQEKNSFLKNFYSYDEILLEISGRSERFPVPQNDPERLWMLFQQFFEQNQ